jgi:hypothetical protein
MRYLNPDQVEYLLDFTSLKTRFKSESVVKFIKAIEEIRDLHPDEASRKFYLDYDENAVCLSDGSVLFHFNPRDVDLVELNYRGKESEL